jgi:hypothetical protein
MKMKRKLLLSCLTEIAYKQCEKNGPDNNQYLGDII